MFLFLLGSSESQFQSVGGFFSGDTMFRLGVRPHIGQSSPREGEEGNSRADAAASADTEAARRRGFRNDVIFITASSSGRLFGGRQTSQRETPANDRRPILCALVSFTDQT